MCIWCAGAANPGYTPRVGPGSPVVTFAANLTGVDVSNYDAFVIAFPSAVLSATNAPDTTVIFLDLAEDDAGDTIILLAVVFNRSPIANAQLSANLFFNKLNATMYNSTLVPFPGYTSSKSTIFDLSRHNATSGKNLP